MPIILPFIIFISVNKHEMHLSIFCFVLYKCTLYDYYYHYYYYYY